MELAHPLRRWHAQGKPQRTELYVRWSLYIAVGVEPLAVLGTAVGQAEKLSVLTLRVLALGALTGTVLSLLLVRAGLAHYLGRRPRPGVLLAVSTTVALAGVWALVLTGGDDMTGVSMSPLLLMFWFGPVTVVLPHRLSAAFGGIVLVLVLPALLLVASRSGPPSGCSPASPCPVCCSASPAAARPGCPAWSGSWTGPGRPSPGWRWRRSGCGSPVTCTTCSAATSPPSR